MSNYAQTHIIRFDGRYFSYTDLNGNLVQIPAISGNGEKQNSDFQNLINKGPIPEGLYDVRQTQYDNFADSSFWQKFISKFAGEWRGGEDSWGAERIWLKPQVSTETFGRSGFSIHGGIDAGSRGCIDLVNNSPIFFEFFKSLGEDAVLQVDYGNGYDGSDNPLLNGIDNPTIENIYAAHGLDLNSLQPLKQFEQAIRLSLERQLQISIPEENLHSLLKAYDFTSADSVTSLLSQYGLNTNLSDYSNLAPSFIINDGHGNNFNMLALPNFSDLFGDARQQAQENFLTQFFDKSFFSLDYNLDQFNDFLNQNRVSFSDFKGDVSEVFGIDNSASGSFSESFNKFFSDSFLSELSLNEDVFEVTTTLGNGREVFAGEIEAEEIYAPSFDVPSLTYGSESISLSADDFSSLVDGYGLYGYVPFDQYYFESEYERLINNSFSDLEFKQEQFIGDFNESLQEFIAENPFDWQDKFSDFARVYENEWQGMIDNAISQFESDAYNLINEYQDTLFYDPDSIEIESINGSLLEGDEGEWEFDPNFDGGDFSGHGYFVLTAYWDPGYSSDYYSYDDWYSNWDYDGDGYIDEDEYSAIDFDSLAWDIREQIFDASGISEDFVNDYLDGDLDYAEEFGLDSGAIYDLDGIEDGGFDEYWKYIDEDYDLRDYWDIEVEVSFDTASFDSYFADFSFDAALMANSWRLEMSSSWDPNDIVFDVDFDANFNFDQTKTRQDFLDFLFNFEYQPTLNQNIGTTYNIAALENITYRLIEINSSDEFVSEGVFNEIITVKTTSSKINSGAGSDVINGGSGIDKINAGIGDDVLVGNAGNDILEGGMGNDIYVFDSVNSGQDMIIDADGAIMIDNRILAGTAIQEGKASEFKLGDAVLIKEGNDLKISYGINNSILIKDFENGKFNIFLNHNPQSTLISLDVNENEETLIDVLLNSSDIDGDNLTIFAITSPQHGLAEIIDGKIKYNPTQNFEGQDSFKYLIGDGKGGFIEKTLHLNIGPEELLEGAQEDNVFFYGNLFDSNEFKNNLILDFAQSQNEIHLADFEFHSINQNSDFLINSVEEINLDNSEFVF